MLRRGNRNPNRNARNFTGTNANQNGNTRNNINRPQRGRNNNTGRNNNDNRRNNVRRIQDNDPCPLPGHAGHTWGMCYSNANSRNNRSTTQTTTRASNNTGRDSHINERNREFARANNLDTNAASYLTDEQIKQENIEPSIDSYLTFDVPNSYTEPGDETTDPLDSLEPEIFDTPFQESFQILEDKEQSEDKKTDNENKKEDLIPQVLTLALSIGGQEGKFNMIALLDTGGSGAMINTRAVPEGARTKTAPNGKLVTLVHLKAENLSNSPRSHFPSSLFLAALVSLIAMYSTHPIVLMI